MHRIHNLSSKMLVVHYPTPEFNRWGRVVIGPGAVVLCPPGPPLSRELTMLWEGPDIYLRCGDEPYVAPQDAKVYPPGVHFEGIYFFVNGGPP